MNDDSYIYSISVRNAGEKFDIKTKINKMKGIKKIKFVRDYFTPDPEWNNICDNNIDYIYLFQGNKKDKEFKDIKNGNISIEDKIIHLLKNNLYNDEPGNDKDNKDNKENKNYINNIDIKNSKNENKDNHKKQELEKIL